MRGFLLRNAIQRARLTVGRSLTAARGGYYTTLLEINPGYVNVCK